MGKIIAYDKSCCIIYDDFFNRAGVLATLDEFKKKLEELALEYPEDERNVFKGDMFETFAEIFFNAFPNDPRVGLTEYTPVRLEDDYGVDGYGVNAAGKQCAVQVKYRSNPLDSITYGELSKTYTSSMLYQWVPLSGDNCLYVFTTAYDVTPPNNTVFKKMIRVISHKIISQEIDNNVNFWKFAYNEIKDTLNL